MSDPTTIAAADILAEELSEITPAMIEAASVALTNLEVEILPAGKRRLRMVREDQRMATVYLAMLAAKLGERG